jgi:hypothetical protein
MADLIIQSNLVSPLLTGLIDREPAQDLSYMPMPSFPILAKQVLPINASPFTATDVFGTRSEFLFNIPRSMFLYKLMVEHKLTFASSTIAQTAPIGKNALSLIEISSNNKVLARWSEGSHECIYSDRNSSESANWSMMAYPMDPVAYGPIASGATAQGEVRFFTMIPWSLFEAVQSYPELGNLEQLTVRIQYNSSSRAGWSGTTGSMITAPTAAASTPRLWSYKVRYDQKNYDAIMAKNQSGKGGIMNVLAMNTFVETAPIGVGNTQSIRLKSNYPVAKTHIVIKKDTTTYAGGRENSFVGVNSFSFSVGGLEIFSSDTPPVVLNADSGSYNSKLVYGGDTGSTPVFANQRTIITIPWNLVPNLRTGEVTGAVSFAQLNNPTLTLNITNPGPGVPCTAYVVHEYHQILTRDATGQFDVVVQQ